MKHGEFNVYLGDDSENLLIKIQCFVDDRWVPKNLQELMHFRLEVLASEVSHKLKDSYQKETEQ